MEHFLIISFIKSVFIMAKLFMPKCNDCRERLKQCKACKKCWIRKSDQLAMLQEVDLKKYWRAIPARWKDRSFVNHFLIIFEFLSTLNVINWSNWQVYCTICGVWECNKNAAVRHAKEAHPELIAKLLEEHQEIH